MKLRLDTAAVATRPRASVPAETPAARSISDMIQPPKMSPAGLVSAGIATVRSDRSPFGWIAALVMAWAPVRGHVIGIGGRCCRHVLWKRAARGRSWPGYLTQRAWRLRRERRAGFHALRAAVGRTEHASGRALTRVAVRSSRRPLRGFAPLRGIIRAPTARQTGWEGAPRRRWRDAGRQG